MEHYKKILEQWLHGNATTPGEGNITLHKNETNKGAILFNEPTSVLDTELVLEVLMVIKELAKEHMTMLIVIHEISCARDVGDRIVFMDVGIIVEEGNPKDIFSNPKHDRTKQFFKKILY